jgi:hypothetical protein
MQQTVGANLVISAPPAADLGRSADKQEWT